MRPPTAVRELVGVYDADGGVTGELRYVVGHLLGTAECALCDITHGTVRRKPAWDAMAGRLGVPITLVHRNERTPEVAAATGGALPCVVAITDSGVVLVLDATALSSCGGDVATFESKLDAALRDQPS
jgi:hypothetical protein